MPLTQRSSASSTPMPSGRRSSATSSASDSNITYGLMADAP